MEAEGFLHNDSSARHDSRAASRGLLQAFVGVLEVNKHFHFLPCVTTFCLHRGNQRVPTVVLTKQNYIRSIFSDVPPPLSLIWFMQVLTRSRSVSPGRPPVSNPHLPSKQYTSSVLVSCD